MLPWKKCWIVGSIVNVNMWTYNKAIMLASFPAIVMAKSCSLLSVIIVGVFCSGVRDSKLKLTPSKLLIGVVATIGIIVFNFFQPSSSSSTNKPLTLISLGNLFLIISLIGDGFLPDFQAQLKSNYKPSSIEMYTKVNRVSFLIALAFVILTGKIFSIWEMIWYFQGFAWDLFMLGFLNAIGQLFVYRMIKEYRQHIPAFTIALRKCLTVIINILWYNHSVNGIQLLGITLVFLAVFSEVVSNYLANKKK